MIKSWFLCLTLIACSHPAIANVLEQTSLTDLQVIRAEEKWNYGVLELKGKNGSAVLVSCPDLNRLGVPSSIRLQYFDANDGEQVRIYGGPDFYCFGAIDLAARVPVGTEVNFNLVYAETADGPIVTSVSVTAKNGLVLSQYDFQRRSSARWKLLPRN